MNEDSKQHGGASLPESHGSQISDTDRLNYLMQFFRVDDCGDEDVCPGVIVDQDAVSAAFDMGAISDERVTLMDGWLAPDMRRVIDKALRFHSANK